MVRTNLFEYLWHKNWENLNIYWNLGTGFCGIFKCQIIYLLNLENFLVVDTGIQFLMDVICKLPLVRNFPQKNLLFVSDSMMRDGEFFVYEQRSLNKSDLLEFIQRYMFTSSSFRQ